MSRRVAAAWVPVLWITLAGALWMTLAAAAGHAQGPPAPRSASPDSLVPAPSETQAHVRAVIEGHLGRPYVWGACGLKSFDCSGFVWRVMQENGILVKRTTARKYFLSLPKVPERERLRFGNVVFFSNLKHCGIVNTRESFYHAAVTAGTHLSRFDPFWRPRISGVRAIPGIERQGAAKGSAE